MPLQATSGAASYDAFGGGVVAEPNYIESCFSTYLYTGNGTQQTIVNGIDLATYGGMVWEKQRNISSANYIIDTARGMNNVIYTNGTAAQFSVTGASANSNGYTSALGWGGGNSEVGWTFRKQPKFFDVVTFTTDVNGYALVSHNLGSTPAFVITKTTSSGGSDWACYHKDLNGGVNQGRYIIRLNKTDAADNPVGANNWIVPTSTTLEFPAGIWLSGNTTYVAYLFAHNAGGFGLTGTDNVISCGSFTTDASANFSVNLGYEPQWVLLKRSSGSGDWFLIDNMRGWTVNGQPDSWLLANTSNSESSADLVGLNATGFESTSGNLSASSTYIYIAIRRGPMKVPTVGTSVFTPATRTGTGTATTITSAGFPVDLVIGNSRNAVSYGAVGAFGDRLRGKQNLLYSEDTQVEDTTNISITGFDVQNGISVGNTNAYSFNYSGGSYVNWFMRRAPSFFDEVCYSGNSVAGRTLTHNLGVVPQLIIVKARTIDVGWAVYAEPAGNTKYSELNDVVRFTTGINFWNDTSPTASVFSLSSNAQVNRTGDTYVAYLFATCAGVSKVGSYTGTQSLLTIDCGFTSGARFVLIKNQNVNGSWYVWDSARGITSGNDPYLLLNTTAAEVTNTNYVDTDSTGFKVTSNTAVNTSGDTYIFLAIA